MLRISDETILKLLDREPTQRDISTLSKFYRNKTILVTGGAGTIGSQLVKILLELNPKEVIAVDWWENGLFYLQKDLETTGGTTARFYLADVKTKAIERIFKKHTPDIVVHASAYKHVPLVQNNPLEGFNNNVFGTLNVVETSVKYGVKNFVLVSTDKAVNPTNIMGATKRLAEIIMEHQDSETIFNAVRFGNVIQSNGSVVPTFLEQIENNQNLTVTNRNITRYFMSRRQAVELILLSATIAKDSEIFLLDMGEPIKISTLATKLIQNFESGSKIIYTGLRAGEKMYEELSYNKQNMYRTEIDEIMGIRTSKSYERIYKSTMEFLPRAMKYSVTDTEIKWFFRKLNFEIK